MESMPAYSRAMGIALIHQWANKPLFGKPYLKGGQCFGLWGYLFEVGGLLAAKYRTNLDAFGSAFLGMNGPPGAMKTGCTDVANNLVSGHRVSTSTTFFDFAQAAYAEQMKHQGDPRGINYFKTHGLDRIPLEFAGQFSWHCAADAVAVAAIHPETFRAMFERTYAPVSREQWGFAVSAGLDIGKEQPRRDYEGAEEAENKAFLEYCKQSRPQLYSILVG
jgi:hypothetical protein